MIFSRRHLLGTAATAGAALTLRAHSFSFVQSQDYAERVPLDQIAADPLRPQFHLMPSRNWMNDPDGPIYWKNNYHIFFQYNPDAAVWGNMNWAHAVSPDMIRWKHMPIALAPSFGGNDQDGCFSGSAVTNNGVATILYTGVKSVPPAQATLRDGTHNFLEVQCLATSTDSDLRTWQKLPQPVLLPPQNPRLTGFRDPFLYRTESNWLMGVGSGLRGLGGQVLLYRSADLRDWRYVHPLAMGKGTGKQAKNLVEAGEMWECPDFFALGKKYVLLYSTERKVYWETGEFDTKRLIFHREKQGLLDHGAFYAPKSQLDANGRRILWGWINETRPAAELRAAGWAGCMSLPRILALAEDGSLKMEVIPELAQLRQTEMYLPVPAAGNEARLAALSGMELKSATAEIELTLQPKPIHLAISDGSHEILTVAFDPGHTGQEWQVGDISIGYPSTRPDSHHLRIFLDGSVAECFVDDKLACTYRTYRTPKAKLHVQIAQSEFAAVQTLRVWPLQPISPDRLTS
jgi:beta-fructofuranosidase